METSSSMKFWIFNLPIINFEEVLKLRKNWYFSEKCSFKVCHAKAEIMWDLLSLSYACRCGLISVIITMRTNACVCHKLTNDSFFNTRVCSMLRLVLAWGKLLWRKWYSVPKLPGSWNKIKDDEKDQREKRHPRANYLWVFSFHLRALQSLQSSPLLVAARRAYEMWYLLWALIMT